MRCSYAIASLPALLLLLYQSWQPSPVIAPPVVRRPQQLTQRAWQSRWAPAVASSHSAIRPAANTAAPSDPAATQPPLLSHQSAEARRAIAMALAEPIPPTGDGRRGGYDHQANVQKESDTVRHMLAQDGFEQWVLVYDGSGCAPHGHACGRCRWVCGCTWCLRLRQAWST